MWMLFLASLLAADADKLAKPPTEIAIFIQRAEDEKQSEIARLKREIGALVAARRKASNRTQLAKIKMRLSNYKKHLKKISEPDYFATPELKTLLVGSIGRPFENRILVKQVIDKDEAIVEFSEVIGRKVISGRVTGVPKVKRYTIWLKGIPTDRFADGNGVEIDTVLQITGNTSYTNTLGAQKTVLVAEPFDLKTLDKYIKR